jgi:ABC-type dipeptide/oligopeptide/nickel transport system permease component
VRMRTFIVRRLLLLIPVLFGVTLLVFTLTRFGDPLAAYASNPHLKPADIELIRQGLHLNDPIPVQYVYWLESILKLDWGYSKAAGMDVSQALVTYFPATFELTLVSMVIATVIGISLGTLSAVRRDKPIDHASRIMALTGVSFPIFWLGIIFQFVFYAQLHLLPVGGRFDYHLFSIETINTYTGFYTLDTLLNGNIPFFFDVLVHLIMPATVLALGTIAILTRIMRSSMLEVLNLDYVKTARSKGLSEKTVIRKHARKNALLPTTTVVGLAFGGLLGGAVLTETIFQWPGLGWWSTKSIAYNETSSIMAFTIIVAIIYVLANLIVDLMYAYLDPRVRLG